MLVWTTATLGCRAEGGDFWQKALLFVSHRALLRQKGSALRLRASLHRSLKRGGEQLLIAAKHRNCYF